MEIKIKFKPNPEYRLMDQVREVYNIAIITTGPNSLTLSGYFSI